MHYLPWTNTRNNHAKQGIVFTDYLYISTTKYIAVDTLRKYNFYKLCTHESIARYFEHYT